MTHPTALGHVHLEVRDVDRAIEFYRDVLGLDVTDRAGNYAFLTYGGHHHDVALQGVGADAPGPGPGVGLYHAAFEVDDPDALRQTHRRLRERGVAVSPVDHGISKALYFDDPDGNGLEVYLDTRGANDREEWRGENERFDPTALGADAE
jgi:catechol 2,3-dioxygenase